MRTTQVALVLALLLALAVTLLAQTSTVTSSTTIPVNNTSMDLCTGEDVSWNGTVVVTVTTWVDGNGAHHAMFSDDFDESGVGVTSNLPYTVVGVDNKVEYASNDLTPFEVTHVAHMNVNGSGAAANEITRVLFHTTISADGTGASSIDNTSFHCTGH